MEDNKRLPKTHKDYWKSRVEKLIYTDRKTKEKTVSGEYSIRLYCKGRREYFPLNSSNKATAATKAKEIYTFLNANGWSGALAEYKPKEETADVATVGDLVAKATKNAEVRPLTLRQYIGALRKVVGAINGINSDDKSKYRPGGSDWQVKVDKVKLSTITRDKVVAWKKAQTKGLTPKEKKTRDVSVDSTLNKVRSVWKHADGENPFDVLTWKQTAKKFKPTVDAPTLLYYAVEELEKEKPELFKAFVLCVFFGLRKGEADCMTWAQVDLNNRIMKVEVTEYFQPKSENGEREMSIDDAMVEKLKAWHESSMDAVFILEGGEARPFSKHTYYRAGDTWGDLITWLKEKDVVAPKPIHYLRKLAGSLMYAANDVVAAKEFLGHSDIRTTIGSYVEAKKKTFKLEAKKPESNDG